MAAIRKFVRRPSRGAAEDFWQRMRVGAVGAGLVAIMTWGVKWIC